MKNSELLARSKAADTIFLDSVQAAKALGDNPLLMFTTAKKRENIAVIMASLAQALGAKNEIINELIGRVVALEGVNNG
jgi:hypothetical protein